MEHLSNDHEEYPDQHKNNHELYGEMGRLVLGLFESQYKLRQKHDQSVSFLYIRYINMYILYIHILYIGNFIYSHHVFVSLFIYIYIYIYIFKSKKNFTYVLEE